MKKSKKSKFNNSSEQIDPKVDNANVTDTQGDSTAVDERNWEQDYAEINDKYLRLYSEFDNYRRRTSRERLELMKSAASEVLSELIPIADDFERTIESINNAKEDNLPAMLEGIKLVQQKFTSVLQRQGLTPMDAKEKDFDPDFHEAITKIPAPNNKLKGKVVDVIEKGYMLNEKVLRYAKVVVGE